MNERNDSQSYSCFCVCQLHGNEAPPLCWLLHLFLCVHVVSFPTGSILTWTRLHVYVAQGCTQRLLLALVSMAATAWLLFKPWRFAYLVAFLHLSAVSVFVLTSRANDCMVALKSM